MGSALRFGTLIAPQNESKPEEPTSTGPSDRLSRAGAKIRAALRLRGVGGVNTQALGGEGMRMTLEQLFKKGLEMASTDEGAEEDLDDDDAAAEQEEEEEEEEAAEVGTVAVAQATTDRDGRKVQNEARSGGGGSNNTRAKTSTEAAASSSPESAKGKSFTSIAEGMFEDIENKKKRKQLKTDPQLMQETRKLWDTADCGMRMNRNVYMDYHTSLYCFLTGQNDLNSFASEAWDAAIDDWESDTQGWDDLHYEAFHDSVFEIIDLHTTNVSRVLYVRYAKALVRGVTKVKQGTRKWRQTWPREKRPGVCDELLEVLRDEIGVQKGSDSSKDQKRVARAFAEWCDETRDIADDEEGGEAGDAAPGKKGKLLSMEMFEAVLTGRLKSAKLLECLKDVAVLTAIFRRCDADDDGRLSVSDVQVALLGSSKRAMRTMTSVAAKLTALGGMSKSPSVKGFSADMLRRHSSGTINAEDLPKPSAPTSEKPSAPQRAVSSKSVAPPRPPSPSKRSVTSKVLPVQ